MYINMVAWIWICGMFGKRKGWSSISERGSLPGSNHRTLSSKNQHKYMLRAPSLQAPSEKVFGVDLEGPNTQILPSLGHVCHNSWQFFLR